MTPIQDCIINKNTKSKPLWIMRQAGRYLPEFREIRAKNNDFIKIFPNDIVIIEGAITFEIEKNHNVKDFFLSIDEETRKQRVINEYLVRGLSYDDAISVYASRLIDEFPYIMKKTFINSNAIEINLNNILNK